MIRCCGFYLMHLANTLASLKSDNCLFNIIGLSTKLSGSMRLVPLSLLLAWLGAITGLISSSMLLSDGKLIYTLDDPYIHLAVAENILRGGYGVNIQEYSSPSSSMLYPFLLAVTEFVGLGSWGPLIINLIATAAALLAVGELITRHIVVRSSCSGFFALTIGLIVAASMNSWGLPMTGMEHSLHVLTVALVILG